MGAKNRNQTKTKIQEYRYLDNLNLTHKKDAYGVWNHLHLCPSRFQWETIFVTSYLLTWRRKSSKNGIYSCGKEFALLGANSFLHEMNPIYMGGTNENDRVVSPEYVPIHLNAY